MNDQQNFAIAVHGGAGEKSEFIRKNEAGYKAGLERATNAAYRVLQYGGGAVEAVEAAINVLEDDPLFNAGKGSALNEAAMVEMCASIMDGRNMQCGAAAIVKNVKNPISLSRSIMQHSGHLYLGDKGASDYARDMRLTTAPDAYFITEETYRQYEQTLETMKQPGIMAMHGTVGAVALDKNGNLAAGTSTGGTECCKRGRIGDSSMIGAGTYANQLCAVSATGDGEYNILYNTAFHMAALMEYKEMNVQEAARFLLHEKLAEVAGDMGLIAMDAKGNLAMEFNTERMHRAWRTSGGDSGCLIYNKE